MGVHLPPLFHHTIGLWPVLEEEIQMPLFAVDLVRLVYSDAVVICNLVHSRCRNTLC